MTVQILVSPCKVCCQLIWYLSHSSHEDIAAALKVPFDRKHCRKPLPISAQEQLERGPSLPGQALIHHMSRAKGMHLSLCQSQHNVNLRCKSATLFSFTDSSFLPLYLYKYIVWTWLSIWNKDEFQLISLLRTSLKEILYRCDKLLKTKI